MSECRYRANRLGIAQVQLAEFQTRSLRRIRRD